MDRSPSPPKRLRQIQKEQTRARILGAAREILYRRGFANTSIGQIVEEAGVGRQTFYFHFRNKEEIIGELISEYHSKGANVMRRLPAPDPSLDDLKDWLIEYAG